MKIKSLKLIQFGKFKGQTYDFSTERINLVFGENEAGKSTLFEAFKTLISGFYPANRDKFKYIPWGEDEASLEMESVDGEFVQRKLRSSVQGIRKKGTESEKIQNRPLFSADRALIENLYTLEADDLLSIDKTSMEMVFEEMSTTFDNPDMLSPKQALEQLEKRRKNIYTNNAHSNKPVNLIDMELGELKEAIVDIDESVSLYRKDQALFEQTEKHSLELAGQIEQVKKQIEHIHHLEAKAEEYQNLNKARQAIHQEMLSRSLNTAYLDKYREIRFELENLQDQLRSRLARLQKEQSDHDPLSETEDQFLDQFEVYTHELQKREAEIERLQNEAENLQQTNLQLHEQFQRIGAQNYHRVPEIQGYEIPVLAKSPISFIPSLVLLLFGLGLLIPSLLNYLKKELFLIVGGGLTLLSLLSLAFWLYTLLRYRSSRNRLGLMNKAQPRDTAEMAKLAHDHAQNQVQIEEKNEQRTAREAELNDALAVQQFEQIDEVYAKERLLIRRRERQLEKEAQLAKTQSEVERLQEELAHQQEIYEGHILPLKAYGQEEQAALAVLSEDLAAISFYDKLLARWEQSPLDEADFAVIDRSPLDGLTAQQNALEEEFRTIISDNAAARERMRHYEKLKPIEEYHNEIRALEEQRQELLYEYNTYLLLHEVLRRHYGRFIESHQPALLEKASEYLKAFSSNRYHQILSVEDEFFLRKSTGELVQLTQSHSKGTRSQIYLALRLAIIQSVEKEHKLPLFFDEAFSNWDNPRLKRTLAVLKNISKERQVFIFTCRAEDAALIREQTDCHYIELEENTWTD